MSKVDRHWSPPGDGTGTPGLVLYNSLVDAKVPFVPKNGAKCAIFLPILQTHPWAALTFPSFAAFTPMIPLWWCNIYSSF